MKNFGFAGMDNVAMLGTNAKMSEISAAMGLSVFAKLDDILKHNHQNYLAYQQQIEQIAGVRLFNYDHLEKANWQLSLIHI